MAFYRGMNGQKFVQFEKHAFLWQCIQFSAAWSLWRELSRKFDIHEITRFYRTSTNFLKKIHNFKTKSLQLQQNATFNSKINQASWIATTTTVHLNAWKSLWMSMISQKTMAICIGHMKLNKQKFTYSGRLFGTVSVSFAIFRWSSLRMLALKNGFSGVFLAFLIFAMLGIDASCVFIGAE